PRAFRMEMQNERALSSWLAVLAVAVADSGSLDELGEGHVLEHPPALLVDPDPHLLEDAVAFAMVGMLRHRQLGPFDCGHDVGERDVFRWVREHVTAAHAALRANEARALHRQQDLLEIGLRQRRSLRDLLD